MKQVFAALIFAAVSFFAVAQAPASPAAVPTTLPAASKPISGKPGAAPVLNKTATPAVPAAPTKPAWVELTAMQQQALRPLEASWSVINEAQKRKWLELSKNYQKLSPVEQTTMHGRMVEWVRMSPQDRAAARLNFAKTKELSKELTGDEKKARWESYQALSPVEKAKLAANASKPSGAATAVKPVEMQKLAATPKIAPILPKPPMTTPVRSAAEQTPTSALAPALAPAN